MTIDVKYYPSDYDITVQFGWWENDYFNIEYCNHANVEKDTAYTFDGYKECDYYFCRKCDETFDIWEVENDPYDSDWAYQSWKDSQL